MALSPAQRHLARHRAAAVALAAGLASADAVVAPPHPDEGEDAQTYRLLMTQLIEDRRRLSDIAATDNKIAAKRDMIGAYDDYVDAVLDAARQTGQAVQDEIVVTVMIWSLDLELWSRALDIAEHVFRFGLQLPQRFKRDAPTFVVEQIAEAALKAAKLDADFDRDVLSRILLMAQPYDIVDIVQAKLRKAMGLQLVRLANGEAAQDGPAGQNRYAVAGALEMFESAYRLDPKIGVTKDIESLKRQLKKIARPESAPEPVPSDPDQDAANSETAAAQPGAG